MWSVAIGFLGTVVAAPFRRHFILSERLRYPSATASGTLIGILFGKDRIVARTLQPRISTPKPGQRGNGIQTEFQSLTDGASDRSHLGATNNLDESFAPIDISNSIKIFLASLAGSFCL